MSMRPAEILHWQACSAHDDVSLIARAESRTLGAGAGAGWVVHKRTFLSLPCLPNVRS